VTTALSASVTLILGAVVGALPALLAGSWSDPQTRDQTWVLIGFLAISAVAAVTALVLYRKRHWVLHQNGTAYVIQELTAEWARQDEKTFLDSAGRYFARVLGVPGPGRLGQSWHWPLGDGARRWNDKVDELARSFLALRTADDPGTPSGILMWASWAVAVAFGLRVTAADRNLVLDVWHRPSRGRAGNVETVIGTQRPHRFGNAKPAPLTGLPPESAPREVTWPARLIVSHLGPRPRRRAAAGKPISVLLLRLGQDPWGPLADVLTEPEPADQHDLKIDDPAGILPASSARVLIHELRCLPPSSGQFPWDAFPALVATCADWIEDKATELEGHLLLLGTTMPPETALGLGITAAQASRARWPGTMWPLVYQSGGLAVPRLNLGTNLGSDEE
jgi:hypothetical protein